MKNIPFLILFLICSFSVYAQTDTIAHVKKSMGKVYKKDGKIMTMKMLETTLKENKAATIEFKRGKTNLDIGTVFSAFGGGAIGYSLGSAAVSHSLNLPLVAVGAGLIGIAIPFTHAADKHLKRAVRMYNDGKTHKMSGKPLITDINVCFTGNGIGLQFSF